MNDSLRAALTLVRAQLLCQMRAPYQHIKIFHSHQLPAPKTAGPGEVKNLHNECIPNSLEICRKRNLHIMPTSDQKYDVLLLDKSVCWLKVMRTRNIGMYADENDQ